MFSIRCMFKLDFLKLQVCFQPTVNGDGVGREKRRGKNSPYCKLVMIYPCWRKMGGPPPPPEHIGACSFLAIGKRTRITLKE